MALKHTLVPARARRPVMEEVPLSEQIWKYMKRLRASVPFPCSPAQAYFGCVPDLVMDMHKKGYFDDDMPLPGKALNLLHTMFATFESTSTRSNPLKAGSSVVHVSLDEQSRYLDNIRSGGGFERVFWFKPPDNVPVPRNSVSVPFWLPQDHPHFTQLCEWYAQASKLTEQISRCGMLFTALDELAPSAPDLRHHWPKIMNFVTFKRNVQPNHARNGKIGAVISHYDTETIIELLATATMLPEKGKPLRAWVGFYQGATSGDDDE